MTWYHGGVPDLLPGDLLLPPDETGIDYSITSGAWRPAGVSDEAVARAELRTDRVYLTTCRGDAIVFAGLWTDGRTRAGGAVYAVQPLGGFEPDPDYTGDPCLSWRVPRARILHVVRYRVRAHQLAIR